MTYGRIDVMKKTDGLRARETSKRLFHYVIPVMLMLPFLFVFWMIVPLHAVAVSGHADENLPLWWSDAKKRAEEAKFSLIDFPKLQTLVQSGKELILLDVRPDYEYKDGHIPGALNFEFHLGHRSRMAPERARALKALLGPKKDRLIVTYCRNFK